MKESGGPVPSDEEVISTGNSGNCVNGENTLNLTSLADDAAKSVYVVVVDAACNKSAVLQVRIIHPPPKPPAASGGKGLGLQIGANAGDTLTVCIEGMDATHLGVRGSAIATQDEAGAAITTIDAAINLVSTQRAALGALQNRLEHTLKNLGIAEKKSDRSRKPHPRRGYDKGNDVLCKTANRGAINAGHACAGERESAKHIGELLR